MPCWFYDKKELLNTPSARDGISADVEAWYRKEGAKHIIDAGNKLGLRFDTCATGVVYFHRFYMFHSFKEFHRLVTAACCLFLAGKVEETPKKCKDIIKTFRSMLTDAQFLHFGDDPKEEVMTLERILLQTIKFDLMVEHPYAYLLKFAKLIKGDKSKVQKMVQMAWTFINDSLCTTLCLQWEPEIIAVAVMYLTSRLTKFNITDWHGKPAGYRGKWYEFIVEDVTLELLEDICHQVLDLYSKTPHSHKDMELAAATSSRAHAAVASGDDSQSRLTPKTPQTPRSPSSVKRNATGSVQPMDTDAGSAAAVPSHAAAASHALERADRSSSSSSAPPANSTQQHTAVTSSSSGVSSYSSGNPYMSKQMYSSSFMSTEGSQSIQSLIGGHTRDELDKSSLASHILQQSSGNGSGAASQYSTPTLPLSAHSNTQHSQPVVSTSSTSSSAAAAATGSAAGYRASAGYSEARPSAGYSEPRASSGYSEPRPSSGYSEPRASSGYSEARPSAGYSEPRASSGYSEPRASSGYSEPRPSAGYSEPRASSGYSEARASSGYSEARPSAGYSEAGYQLGWSSSSTGQRYASAYQQAPASQPARQSYTTASTTRSHPSSPVSTVYQGAGYTVDSPVSAVYPGYSSHTTAAAAGSEYIHSGSQPARYQQQDYSTASYQPAGSASFHQAQQSDLYTANQSAYHGGYYHGQQQPQPQYQQYSQQHHSRQSAAGTRSDSRPASRGWQQ